MILEKLQRADPTLRGHFAPAYWVGSNMLRAYLFFIYATDIQTYRLTDRHIDKQTDRDKDRHTAI